MLRSLFSAISGLESFQTDLDVVGNNIANADTPGFKASEVQFADLFYQTLRGASAPTPQQGGTNPVQVGLGTQVGDIAVNTSQGSIQTTGVQTDMAIQGAGYFMVQSEAGTSYTRAGAFSFDANGDLVDPQGDKVLGWVATNGQLPGETQGNLQPIQIPITQTMPASATTSVTLGGNLDATTASGGSYSVGVNVVDSLGQNIPVVITFTETTTDQWTWSATVSGVSATTSGNGTLTFSTSGTLSGTTTGTITINGIPGANPVSVTVDFGNITQYAGADSVAVDQANGYGAGSLQSLSVDPTGTITGVFSNGQKEVLAQVALAEFANPGGLTAEGGGLYQQSNNSGPANVGAPGTGGRGSIVPGALEMSNVDLAQEFTNMLVAERAFQANAEVITASDNVLTTLVQMIH